MLKGTWAYDPKTRKLTIQLKQTQKGHVFNAPLELGMYDKKGDLIKLWKVDLSQRDHTFSLPLSAAPDSVVPDPHTWLLMSTTWTKK